MIKKVSQRILRIRLPLPDPDLDHVYVHLIKRDDEGYILVDTGGGKGSTDHLLKAIVHRGIRPSDIKTVLLTHIHYDHSGGVKDVVEETGAEFVMHEAEYKAYEWIKSLPPNRYSEWFSRLGITREEAENITRAQTAIVSKTNLVTPSFFVRDDERLGLPWLKLIWTPGHTAGHLCIYEAEDKILICGDHILPDTTANISYYSFWEYDPLSDYLNSLERVIGLESGLVFPSHGDAFSDLGRRVSEIKEHHRVRLEEVIKSLSQGQRTPAEIAENISWSLGKFSHLGLLHKWFAILEVMAHIRYLEKRGVVEGYESGHSIRYRLRS